MKVQSRYVSLCNRNPQKGTKSAVLTWWMALTYKVGSMCQVHEDRALESRFGRNGPRGNGARTHVLSLWTTKAQSPTWSMSSCDHFVLRSEAQA